VQDAVPGEQYVQARPSPRGIARPASRVPLPLAAVLVYAAIRGVGLAASAFLLPRMLVHGQHYTLAFLIHSWDSDDYLSIAAHGYLLHGREPWFPGYPAAIDVFAHIPGIGTMHAASIATSLSGLAAAVAISLLAAKMTGNDRIGLLTAALWAVAPGALVLEMDYAEALLCAVAAWGLLALAYRRWPAAGLLALVAGTVHSTGAALTVAVFVAAIPELKRALRHKTATPWWRPATAMVIAPLGLLGYIGYVALDQGSLGAWFSLEHHAGNGFDAGYSIVRYTHLMLAGAPDAPVGPTLAILATCAAAVVLVVWLIASRRRLGVPTSVLWYAATIVFAALTAGPYTFSAKPRFLLPALVLGLPLAALLARVPTWLQASVITVVSAGTIWFTLYKMGPGWQA
jgi:hypothetical protein